MIFRDTVKNGEKSHRRNSSHLSPMQSWQQLLSIHSVEINKQLENAEKNDKKF
jgi:hypothetical protein